MEKIVTNDNSMDSWRATPRSNIPTAVTLVLVGILICSFAWNSVVTIWWTTTKATINRCYGDPLIEHLHSHSKYYGFDFDYTYTVAGKSYKGSDSFEYDDAETAVARMKANSTEHSKIFVYYNPSKPEESKVEGRTQQNIALAEFIIAGVLPIVIGIIMLFVEKMSKRDAY